MNRKQILALEAGREIDILIIENIWGWGHTLREKPHSHVLTDIWRDAYTYHTAAQLPRISRHISHAWHTVELLTEDETREHPLFFRCTYNWNYDKDNEPSAWAAFDWKLTGDSNPLFAATADDMPLAICKAALLAHFDLV